jgi:hypothetical protein
MSRRVRLSAIVAALTATVACGAAPSPPPLVQKAAAPSDSAATTSVPHGDHNPHHGGVVMMKGDLHYEVVLDPSGRDYRLYFSDAVREDLPAAYASAVGLTVRRPGEADEPVVMKIDETGESWTGSGKPVANAAKVGARIAFTIANDPYWIDVPFTSGGGNPPAHPK